MIADVGGPGVGLVVEPGLVAGEEARWLFEPGEVAGYRGEEAVRRLLAVGGGRPGARTAGLLDQLAQRDRGAAGLATEPFRVTREGA